jgi:MFS transporter, DHA2 family, methylenomycin A resistance protein
MLPLELFSSTTFSAANVVGLLLNSGFYGQLFFINLFFQQIKGYSPLLTGLALLPETEREVTRGPLRSPWRLVMALKRPS